jgi:hypothetical protein
MLRIEALRGRNIVVITPDGPLEKADFKFLVKEISPLLASTGKLTGAIVRTKAFPGWHDFGAAACHLRFIRVYQRQIDRVALVTDSHFLEFASRVAPYVVQPAIKRFDPADMDRALAWLEEPR